VWQVDIQMPYLERDRALTIANKINILMKENI